MFPGNRLKKSKVITTERIWKQRKVREGIESEKLKLKGKNLLNNYEHPEDCKTTYFRIHTSRNSEKKIKKTK